MPIPDYESLMLPLVKIAAAANGQEVKLSDAADQLAKLFRLTNKERTELLPSGGTFKFASRVSFDRVKNCSPLKDYSSRIVLIDGHQLSRYMID